MEIALICLIIAIGAWPFVNRRLPSQRGGLRSLEMVKEALELMESHCMDAESVHASDDFIFASTFIVDKDGVEVPKNWVPFRRCHHAWVAHYGNISIFAIPTQRSLKLTDRVCTDGVPVRQFRTSSWRRGGSCHNLARELAPYFQARRAYHASRSV